MTGPRHPQRRYRRSVPIPGTHSIPVLSPDLDLDPNVQIDPYFESELIHAMDEYCARVTTPDYDAAAIMRRTTRRRVALISASTAMAVVVIGTGSALALNHTGAAAAPSASATTCSYSSPVSSPSIASMVTVPQLVGCTEQEALATLQQMGFKSAIATMASTTAPRGTVISQSTAAGTIVPRGSTITLVIAIP